jgi:hypothetical protein
LFPLHGLSVRRHRLRLLNSQPLALFASL